MTVGILKLLSVNGKNRFRKNLFLIKKMVRMRQKTCFMKRIGQKMFLMKVAPTIQGKKMRMRRYTKWRVQMRMP